MCTKLSLAKPFNKYYFTLNVTFVLLLLFVVVALLLVATFVVFIVAFYCRLLLELFFWSLFCFCCCRFCQKHISLPGSAPVAPSPFSTVVEPLEIW
jgi:hypothetical protein